MVKLYGATHCLTDCIQRGIENSLNEREINTEDLLLPQSTTCMERSPGPRVSPARGTLHPLLGPWDPHTLLPLQCAQRHHRTTLSEKRPSYAGRKLRNLLPSHILNLTEKKLRAQDMASRKTCIFSQGIYRKSQW
uniref:Uncharacterized protein n=1 Tax=Cuerna arida TaxID=1464854 RepID=A0A1B6GWU1_9HEMI